MRSFPTLNDAKKNIKRKRCGLKVLCAATISIPASVGFAYFMLHPIIRMRGMCSAHYRSLWMNGRPRVYDQQRCNPQLMRSVEISPGQNLTLLADFTSLLTISGTSNGLPEAACSSLERVTSVSLKGMASLPKCFLGVYKRQRDAKSYENFRHVVLVANNDDAAPINISSRKFCQRSSMGMSARRLAAF